MAQLMYRMQSQFGAWNDSAVVAVMLMVLALVGSALLAVVTRLVVRVGQR